MSAPKIALLVAVILFAAFGIALALRTANRADPTVVMGPPWRLAVLGDSDSHGYRDHVQRVRRGGDYHDVTLQWTEVLAATRGDYFDMGGVGEHGNRGIVARARSWLGLEAKTPRKNDFRWNYSRSGARCATLTTEWPEQTRWLVSAIESDPGAWADGIVVIRIGVNDLGQASHLDEYANTGATDTKRARIAECVAEVSRSIDRIREASLSVRIVVVGIADDSSWPASEVPHRSPEEVARIREVLDLFDRSLAGMVNRKHNAVFMSDRTWYYSRWADRDANGNAQVSGVSLGGRTPVTNTRGDAPNNLSLADGHAGTVANGFWARELIQTLRRDFDLDVPPLTDAEIARVADPTGEYGIAPPAATTRAPAPSPQTATP